MNRRTEVQTPGNPAPGNPATAGATLDRAGFTLLYRAHVEAIQRFVARRVGDPALAADLTADVFVAAIEHLDRYDPTRGSPQAWLFGIARTTVAMELRRVGREAHAARRIHGRRLLEPDDLTRASERIDAERSARQLYRSMAALPDSQRAVLELVALDGLSVTDAAAALGISDVNARVRLLRARRRLTASHPQLAPPSTTALHPLVIGEDR